MRWLIFMLIAVLAASDTFSMDLSLAPGLSVKNAVLYLIIMALFFRTVLSGELKLERPDIHAFFGIWIGYAILTLFVAGFVIEYPGYHLGDGVITLKSYLIDPALFCLAGLWGLKNLRDVRLIVAGLAGAMAVSSFFTVLDMASLVHLNITVGDSGVQEGRVFGVFGHANETGTLLACFLPALFAETMSARRVLRALWLAGTICTIGVFLMTISRGAYVGLVVGLFWGAYLCRRYVPLQRFALWALVIAAIVIVALIVATAVDPYLRGYIDERILGQTMSASIGEVSSGRTTMWVRILDRMLDSPATLITGFGWNVYSTMPFELLTHNHYLDLWFNVGLVGLALFLLIMRRAIVSALDAIPLTAGRDRPMFIAFVFGLLALLIAIFFTNLFRPWPYIWLYVGAMLRGALAVQSETVAAPLALRRAPAGNLQAAGAAAQRSAQGLAPMRPQARAGSSRAAAALTSPRRG